jgi:hypothetical protein
MKTEFYQNVFVKKDISKLKEKYATSVMLNVKPVKLLPTIVLNAQPIEFKILNQNAHAHHTNMPMKMESVEIVTIHVIPALIQILVQIVMLMQTE